MDFHHGGRSSEFLCYMGYQLEKKIDCLKNGLIFLVKTVSVIVIALRYIHTYM